MHEHDYTAIDDREVSTDEETAAEYVKALEALGVAASLVAESVHTRANVSP